MEGSRCEPREQLAGMQASEQPQPTGNAGARMALQNSSRLTLGGLISILPHQSGKACRKETVLSQGVAPQLRNP